MVTELFGKAWQLYRRDVGWLMLAGLVVGAILAAIFALASVVTFWGFAEGVSITASGELTGDGGTGLEALAVKAIALALILYLVFLFVINVLSMVFYGGMFKMVIGRVARRGACGSAISSAGSSASAATRCSRSCCSVSRSASPS